MNARLPTLILVLLVLLPQTTLPASAERIEGGIHLTGAESKILEGGDYTLLGPVILEGNSTLTVKGATIRFESTEPLLTVRDKAILTLQDVKLEAAQTRLRAEAEATVTLTRISGAVAAGLSGRARLEATDAQLRWLRGVDSATCNLERCTVSEYSLISTEDSALKDTTIKQLNLIYVDGNVTVTKPLQGRLATLSTGDIKGDAAPLTHIQGVNVTIEACSLTLSDGALRAEEVELSQITLIGAGEVTLKRAVIGTALLQGFQARLSAEESDVDAVKLILSDADLTAVRCNLGDVEVSADALLRFAAAGSSINYLTLSTGAKPLATLVVLQETTLNELVVTSTTPREIKLDDSGIQKASILSRPPNPVNLHLYGDSELGEEAKAVDALKAVRHYSVTVTADGKPVEGAQLSVEAAGKAGWSGSTDKQGHATPVVAFSLGKGGNGTAAATLKASSPQGSGEAPLTLAGTPPAIQLTQLPQPLPVPLEFLAAAAMLIAAAALLRRRQTV